MHGYIPLPPEPETREPASSHYLAEVSLDSIVFLFQVLVALALTNAAYVFITDGSGGYNLRAWSSYTLYQSLVFVVFVVTLIPFAHANVLILKQSYARGFMGTGLRPFIDFALLFIEAGLFYALSHAVTQVETDFLSFFYIMGAVLVVDVLWAFATFGFDPAHRIVLVYAVLNSIALGVGVALTYVGSPYLRELLLLTLAIRTTLDFVLTYNLLFPDAFRRVPKPARAPAPVGASRNRS